MTFTSELVNAQLPERKDTVSKAIAEVMKDVEPNLQSRNRDRFTQNITAVKRDLGNANINLISSFETMPSGTPNGMMQP